MKNEKKSEERFNIRFNPADPRHKMAIEILGQAGKRKSTLIADAIYHYVTASRDGTEVSLPPSPPGFNPGQYILACDKAEEISETAPEEPVPEKTDEIELPFDNDMQDSILSAMDAFLNQE